MRMTAFSILNVSHEIYFRVSKVFCSGATIRILNRVESPFKIFGETNHSTDINQRFDARARLYSYVHIEYR